MIRERFKIGYTDDDKRNLVIRCHTQEEIKQLKRRFSQKMWKRRLIFILLFILFMYLSRHATSEKAWFWLTGVTMLIAIFGIVAEFITIRGKKEARSPHYVELLILQKLAVEFENDPRADHYKGEFFYPVMARDTTSQYECRYYLAQDEYDEAEEGQIIQVNVLIKELKL